MKHIFRWNAALALVITLLMIASLVPMRAVALTGETSGDENTEVIAEETEGSSQEDHVEEPPAPSVTTEIFVAAPVEEKIAEVTEEIINDQQEGDTTLEGEDEDVTLEGEDEDVTLKGEDEDVTLEGEDEDEALEDEDGESGSAEPVSVGGSLSWAGVPEGAAPSAELTLGGGDGVSRDKITLTYGGATTFSFGELPSADKALVAYPAYTVSVSASEIDGYSYSVSRDGYSATITYTLIEQAEEEPAVSTTLEASGSVAWIGVPEEATPSVTITLGGGDGTARDAIVIAYGGDATYTFQELPSEDEEKNAYPAYTVSAEAAAIECYDCGIAYDGYNVTVTYTLNQSVTEAIQQVVAAIDAYPSVETVGYMDPTRGAFATAIRDFHAIRAMVENIPEGLRGGITNLSKMEDATLLSYILGA